MYTGIKTHHGKIDGPVVLDEDLAVHGMITVSATVPTGLTLFLHGMITGDLVVEEGGRAIIHGMVNGWVKNMGGYVEIHGVVDKFFDASSAAITLVQPNAVIRERPATGL